MTENRLPTLLLSDAFELQYSEEESGNCLLVPIAVLGRWIHPEYKEVVFSQNTFNDILRNFRENRLGYEIPLYIGHSQDEAGSVPRAAYALDITQVDDVLYGLFKCTNQEVVQHVKAGSLPYASAEIIFKAMDRATGEEIGAMLTGVALTPEPFLTGLPKVEAIPLWLSNPNLTPIHMAFRIDSVKPMATNTEYEAMKQELTNLHEENAKLKAQLEAQSLELQKTKLASRVSKIESLNLSRPVKDSFIKALSTSMDDEQYEALLSIATVQSEENSKLLLTQYGKVDATASSTSVTNPHSEFIERKTGGQRRAIVIGA